MNRTGQPRRDWCLYVLQCRNGYLYIGITNNLPARLEAHARGKGSTFVRAWRPFELLKVLECADAGEARRLEHRLKRMKRADKARALGIACGAASRGFRPEPGE